MKSFANIQVQGYIKIIDIATGELIHQGENAVNPETMSIAIANMLAGNNGKYIYEMHFGNGGIVDGTTLKDVEENLVLGTVAELYNPLYFKVVDANDEINNASPTRNFVTVEHLDGLPYTDVIITCTLEENDPEDSSGEITFNEIGLKNRGEDGVNSGYLVTHYVSENIYKSSTRSIQIIYTLRIRL
jgi:hypothetical protein